MICLLANCCFLSETSRMIEIHRALTERGAPVRVTTQGGPFESALHDAGIDYDVLGPGFSEKRCAKFVGSVPGIGPEDQSMWSDQEIRSYVSEEVSYFRTHDVRVAVTGWTLTAMLSTRLVGVPLVTEHAGAFVPPLFERGLLPAPSMAAGLPLERWLPARMRRWMLNAGADRLTGYIGGFNRIAAELGVEGIPSFPALLLGDLALVTDVPEALGLSREDVDGWKPRRPDRYRPTTRLRYTGPLYARLDAPLPERVERFLGGARPIVYVAITSSPPDLVRGVVERLRSLDARILVAATVHDLSGLEDERVLVENLLPSHEIMPRVDLAVTAGGQGSVQTAMASGTPLIGIPLQPEQDTNVVLLERRGAARLVPAASAPTAATTATASEMLADDRYRDGARRLQEAFARADGPGAAADAILELFEDSRHSSHPTQSSRDRAEIGLPYGQSADAGSSSIHRATKEESMQLLIDRPSGAPGVVTPPELRPRPKRAQNRDVDATLDRR